jgi:predicted metal-binding membrane protein
MSATFAAAPGRARRPAAARAVVALAAVAWLAAAGIAAAPFSGYFSHGAIEHLGSHAWAIATLAAGWIVMVAAMMLPTTVPLVSAFDDVIAGRSDRRRLLAILLLGYVLVWLAAGLALHAGDLGVHWLVSRSGWLRDNTWTIATGTLAIAGAYQLSSLKGRCLRSCRAAQAVIRRHWRGDMPGAAAMRMGLEHGGYCVGCCWSLMLVMFSVGVGAFAWMLALTVVMVAEKTLAAGERARVPVGIWLLCGALITAFA